MVGSWCDFGKLRSYVRAANVWATISGNRIVASPWTFTDSQFFVSLPQEIASSGSAPESDASFSCALFM